MGERIFLPLNCFISIFGSCWAPTEGTSWAPLPASFFEVEKKTLVAEVADLEASVGGYLVLEFSIDIIV